MSEHDERCEFAFDDGAYVLGALAPADRAAYERHLATCPSCRQAVAEIAALPGLLSRLDADGLALITEPSPTVESRLPSLLTAARSARRRQRRVTRFRYAGAGLAAACLAVVIGLGADRLIGGGPGDTPEALPPTPTATGVQVRMVAMQPVAGAVPVRAEIGLNGTKWGTEVTMRCEYVSSGSHPRTYTYRLVAYGPDGAAEQVGSWLAAPGEEVIFTGATRFSGADLVRLEVLRANGVPLLGYDVP
ncbi:zf-HC2 domain-containing protein [Micromonospora sp. NBC_01699]|uniref:anti-sigma factor family protein n=1 Tax=Micromonospora sp. NBC_01699 TaxID=2975984 RepID=UPI002E2DC8DF|nr:zf-HC2 domain-containing protein [Micromonospora sp. NBC_01699]